MDPSPQPEPSRPLLVILEDNRRRIQRFDQVVQRHRPDLDCTFSTTAPAFIDWFRRNGKKVAIVSLDHDLDEGNPPASNHQSGSEVAEFLSLQDLRVPVLLHSANDYDGKRMKYTLKESGFLVRRLCPFDDLEWISWRWLPLLQELLPKAVAPDEK